MQDNEIIELVSKYIHEEMWVKWAKEMISSENISRDRDCIL